jgi:hypothetical protein
MLSRGPNLTPKYIGDKKPPGHSLQKVEWQLSFLYGEIFMELMMNSNFPGQIDEIAKVGNPKALLLNRVLKLKVILDV